MLAFHWWWPETEEGKQGSVCWDGWQNSTHIRCAERAGWHCIIYRLYGMYWWQCMLGPVDVVGGDESSFPGLRGEQEIIATFLPDLLPASRVPHLQYGWVNLADV